MNNPDKQNFMRDALLAANPPIQTLMEEYRQECVDRQNTNFSLWNKSLLHKYLNDKTRNK